MAHKQSFIRFSETDERVVGSQPIGPFDGTSHQEINTENIRPTHVSQIIQPLTEPYSGQQHRPTGQ